MIVADEHNPAFGIHPYVAGKPGKGFVDSQGNVYIWGLVESSFLPGEYGHHGTHGDGMDHFSKEWADVADGCFQIEADGRWRIYVEDSGPTSQAIKVLERELPKINPEAKYDWREPGIAGDWTIAKSANILDPIHNTLDPSVFDDADSDEPKLKSIHKKWIESLVYDTFEKNGFHGVRDWGSLVLTGSLTTYQYSDRSDVDVSLFIDSSMLPEWSRAEMIGVAVENCDNKILPGTSHPMQVYVVPSNITREELYKPGIRSGWDFKDEKWIVSPEKNRVHDVQKEMNNAYILGLQAADKMERLIRYEPEKAKMYHKQIHRRRQQDMKRGNGDYADSNIIYKFLDNRGLLPNQIDYGVTASAQSLYGKDDELQHLEYIPWSGGTDGKAITIDGEVVAWVTDREGSPHHFYAVPRAKRLGLLKGDPKDWVNDIGLPHYKLYPDNTYEVFRPDDLHSDGNLIERQLGVKSQEEGDWRIRPFSSRISVVEGQDNSDHDAWTDQRVRTFSSGPVRKYVYDDSTGQILIGHEGAREGEQLSHFQLAQQLGIQNYDEIESGLIMSNGVVKPIFQSGWGKGGNQWRRRYRAQEAIKRALPGERLTFLNEQEKLNDDWDIDFHMAAEMEDSTYEPWRPGEYGKALVHPDGAAEVWIADTGHHIDQDPYAKGMHYMVMPDGTAAQVHGGMTAVEYGLDDPNMEVRGDEYRVKADRALYDQHGIRVIPNANLGLMTTYDPFAEESSPEDSWSIDEIEERDYADDELER